MKLPLRFSQKRAGQAAGIAVFALLLHWGAAQIEDAAMGAWLHGAVTLLALSLFWVFCVPRRSAAVSADGLDALLLQTHPEFAARLAASGDDLGQVRALLADAIAKLLDSFDGLHRLIRARFEAESGAAPVLGAAQRLREAVLDTKRHLAGRADAAQIASRLDDVLLRTEEIEQHLSAASGKNALPEQADAAIGNAVTSLQFQDMVDQLLLHVMRRLDGMRAVWDRLDELARQERDGGRIAPETMARARQEIAALLVHADAARRGNPVRQAQMDSGDVELF